MKVIVSGATGFVASHLIPAVASAGHDVIGIGHDRARIPCEATALELDLASDEWPALPKVDVVVHLAQANVPFPEGADSLFAVNVASTQRLLEHARRTGASRFVLASSGSVYGATRGRLVESAPPAARDFYAGTKVAAERLTQAYDGYMDVAILRLFAPYGPGQTQRMLPRLVDRIRKREPIELNRGGRPRINPIYVDDVVRLVLHLLDRGANVEVLNVAGDEVTDIRRVSELIGEILGVEPIFEVTDKDAVDVLGDNARLHAFLGERSLVPLREGIERTVTSKRG